MTPHCKRWFCNTKYPKQNRSHIMIHSFKSRHHSIRDFNHHPFECSNSKCRLNNIYQLKMDQSGRISCIDCIIFEQGYFNRKKWSPFIREHRLPYGWVNAPRKIDIEKMIILKSHQISALEKLWKKGYNGRYEELEQYDETDEIMRAHKAKDIYKNCNEYVEIMFKLLELHEQDDQKRAQDLYQENVSLQWLNNKKFRLIGCSNYDYFSGYLKHGSYLQVSFHQNDQYVDAIITFIDNKKNIVECELLASSKSKPNYKSDKVDVRTLWMDVSFQRMADAIRGIKNNSFFLSKLHSFFWETEPQDLDSSQKSEESEDSYEHRMQTAGGGGQANGRQILRNGQIKVKQKTERGNQNNNNGTTTIFSQDSKLNISQKTAITEALNADPLTLIQGPPGTGKTFTLYEIIARIHEQNLSAKYKMKILFCAPSNIAVDNLALKLEENKINSVRVYAAMREKSDDIDENLHKISLHRMVQRETGLKHDHHLEDKYYAIYRKEEDKILKEAEIIGCTCSCAGDKRLLNMDFNYVIIDEAAQALEMESLIAINRCTKKLILCGDHKQLGPLVFSNLAKSLGLGMSLFERLAKKTQPILLETQYRMHEKIAEYPSFAFYENKIKTGVKRIINIQFPWPNQESPQLFCHIAGKEEIGPNGTSFLNRDEAYFIKSVVDKLIAIKVKPETIGIITPYLAQKYYLINKEKINENVKIASVDEFQGKEKDYILISCVRSNEELGVGFLHEINRINVAITRAKLGMVICGNKNTLQKNESWAKIFKFYKDHKVLVFSEGDDINDIKRIR